MLGTTICMYALLAQIYVLFRSSAQASFWQDSQTNILPYISGSPILSPSKQFAVVSSSNGCYALDVKSGVALPRRSAHQKKKFNSDIGQGLNPDRVPR